MYIVFTGWLLIVQGIGVSSSTPMILNRYINEEKCHEDAKKIKQKMYIDYICLKVENYQNEYK